MSSSRHRSRRRARRRRGRARRRGSQIRILVILGVVVALCIVGVVVALPIVEKYMPTTQVADYDEFYGLTDDANLLISYNNELSETRGIYENGEAYLPYDFVVDNVNQRFYWDSSEQTLFYTLSSGIVTFIPDESSYTIGSEAQPSNYPICISRNDTIYIAFDYVSQYTNMRMVVYADDGPYRVTINDDVGVEQTYTVVSKKTSVRELGGIKSEVLTTVDKGDYVTVRETFENWVEVCTRDGFIGYLESDCLGDTATETYDNGFVADTFPQITVDHKICMIWHQIMYEGGSYDAADVLYLSPGANVVSPTWFYLSDNDGNISNVGSTSYVDYCHQNNVDVWALVSNLETEVDSTSILSVTTSRRNLISNLISACTSLGVDGINVDIESLAVEAGPGYMQFIRELSLECDTYGLVLSVNSYIPTEYTSLIYNFSEIAQFADYLCLMAYDETYDGSESTGSNASISYVRNGITSSLENVSADRLVLGIPFYSREWYSEGGTPVFSQTLGMTDATYIASSNGTEYSWSDEYGQYYAEWTSGDGLYQVWLEDENSIALKLDAMQENNLAGAAFWKSGQEERSVWNTIQEYF